MCSVCRLNGCGDVASLLWLSGQIVDRFLTDLLLSGAHAGIISPTGEMARLQAGDRPGNWNVVVAKVVLGVRTTVVQSSEGNSSNLFGRSQHRAEKYILKRVRSVREN